MADPLTDETALIAAALTGDLGAFNALVLRFQDSVYALAYRIMGDSSSAADMAQEVFITAYRKLNTHRGGSFKSWLLRITANTCYDDLRRQKRRPAASLEELPDAESGDGPALPDPAPSPEQATQQRELHLAIQNCISSLGADQRIVLVMSDVEGYSYQEIAEVTGVPQGTVKSRLSRARLGMRRCLQAVQELLPAAYRQMSDEG